MEVRDLAEKAKQKAEEFQNSGSEIYS